MFLPLQQLRELLRRLAAAGGSRVDLPLPLLPLPLLLLLNLLLLLLLLLLGDATPAPCYQHRWSRKNHRTTRVLVLRR